MWVMKKETIKESGTTIKVPNREVNEVNSIGKVSTTLIKLKTRQPILARLAV